MFASTISLALAALPFALAMTFEVSVGAGGNLAYNPPYISGAMDGDIVHFTFNPKNHTVTQSSFAEPCVPLAGGFTSGFMPVSNSTNPLPVVTFTVPAGTGSTPLWFHCEQTGHCAKGMVFAINPPAPPSPKDFDAFLALATNSTSNSTSTSTADSSMSTSTSDDSSSMDDGDDSSTMDDGDDSSSMDDGDDSSSMDDGDDSSSYDGGDDSSSYDGSDDSGSWDGSDDSSSTDSSDDSSDSSSMSATDFCQQQCTYLLSTLSY